MKDKDFRQIFASVNPDRVSEVETMLHASGIEFREQYDSPWIPSFPGIPPYLGPAIMGGPPEILHRVLVRTSDVARASEIISEQAA